MFIIVELCSIVRVRVLAGVTCIFTVHIEMHTLRLINIATLNVTLYCSMQ